MATTEERWRSKKRVVVYIIQYATASGGHGGVIWYTK